MVEAEGLTLRFIGLSAGVGGRLGFEGGMKEIPGALGLGQGQGTFVRADLQMLGTTNVLTGSCRALAVF